MESPVRELINVEYVPRIIPSMAIRSNVRLFMNTFRVQSLYV